MVATRPWTLEELHRLPDDGNKYELVRGELFVTPAPSEDHEIVAARLTDILAPYVARHGLGIVFRPRAVFRREGSEVEPDLMVRQPKERGTEDWTDAPLPVLVVEILSPATRRRDLEQKRSFYIESGIPEYWIVDTEGRTITRVLPAENDIASDQLKWSPAGTLEPMVVHLDALFD